MKSNKAIGVIHHFFVALVLMLGFLIDTAHGGTVTLTKDDVTDASDIETAINTATNFGTRVGVVVLDGSKGNFEYTEPDKSINIFVSNFTLRGINGATISNCGDGLFFDDFALSNILIEGINFQCFGNGISDIGLSVREGVTVRNNVFEVASFGIILRNPVNWNILNNNITAGTGFGQSAIALFGGRNSKVTGNTLSAFWGVLLTTVSTLDSTKNKVIENHIEALDTGVRLDGGASYNRVLANRITILDSDGIGIFLDSDTSNNKVHGNKVFIENGGNLVIVEDLGTNNKISGNK